MADSLIFLIIPLALPLKETYFISLANMQIFCCPPKSTDLLMLPKRNQQNFDLYLLFGNCGEVKMVQIPSGFLYCITFPP